jgi:hypothetical protein
MAHSILLIASPRRHFGVTCFEWFLEQGAHSIVLQTHTSSQLANKIIQLELPSR